MLDEYKENQPIIYKILKNAVSNDKASHAYLFETNGFYDSYNFVMAFTKALLCPKQNTGDNNCQDCHQCKVIDSGNFPEIKVIAPSGMWIKKEDMKALQEEFNKKALIGNKKIYIIKDADRLNKEAANSILKFLEEPEEGIIAILLTENIYGVLATIRSRCQILKLKEDDKLQNVDKTLTKLAFILYEKDELEENESIIIEKALKFIKYYETNHLNTLLYTEKLWHSEIKTGKDAEKAFDVMILFYKDILNYLNQVKFEIFNDYENEIKEIAEKNTVKTICDKINILTELKEKLKYNVNQKLLMDKLILKLEGRD